MQAWVVGGDPAESGLLLLAGCEVFEVLPQHAMRVLQLPRQVVAGGLTTGAVPGSAAFLVQRVGGSGHHVVAERAPSAVRAMDPFRKVVWTYEGHGEVSAVGVVLR